MKNTLNKFIQIQFNQKSGIQKKMLFRGPIFWSLECCYFCRSLMPMQSTAMLVPRNMFENKAPMKQQLRVEQIPGKTFNN